MKKTLLGIAIASLAVFPAKADTAFWFTCDFESSAGVQSTSFGLFANTGDGSIVFGEDGDLRPILWEDIGGTTHLFLDDLDHPAWVLTFDVKSQSALGFVDASLARSTACRPGAQ